MDKTEIIRENTYGECGCVCIMFDEGREIRKYESEVRLGQGSSHWT